mgnify:CR=1 FL=1
MQAIDASLILTDVTVREFETNVFFSDTVGGATFVATDVEVGGTSAVPSKFGLLAEGLHGAITLTRVAASFTTDSGLGVGSVGGTIDGSTISAGDGAGMLIGGRDTVANINQVTTAHTVDGAAFAFLSSVATITDVQTTDTAGIGLVVSAQNGTTATLTTARVSTSDDSGIVLTANDSTIIGSDIESHHNGLVPGCGCGGGGSGIELYADNGTVDLSDADLHDNDAESGGGIYLGAITDSAIVDITDVTVTDNDATADGGGIYLYSADTGSTVTVLSATVTGNTAAGSGGGMDLGDIQDAGTAVTVTGSTIRGNTASGTAAAPAIAGGGGILVDGILGGASVTVTGSTISGNTAAEDGGGLYVLDVAADDSIFTLSDSTVSGGNHSGDFGGGVYLLDIGAGSTSTAHVVIVRTTVNGNTANGYGAGVAITDPAEDTNDDPKVLIDSSTVSNNTTPAGGGGLYIGRTNAGASVVQLLNSTLSGNHAQGGGAVYSEGNTPLQLLITQSTLADNRAHTSAGVEDNNPASALVIENSILSGGASDNGSAPDDLSTASSFTVHYSLVQTPGAGVVVSGTGVLTGVAPQLGPLANNGGPTKTHLVAPGSPAFNAGDPAFVGAGLFDQRGQARVYQRVDMGAVEWHPELANTGSTAPEPEPPLVALLLILSGLAMVAFSRLQAARSIG